jgi:hypothetical protein
MSTHTLNFPGADINTTQLTVGTGGLSVNSSVLRVDASASRVGIGILTPQHTLDVVGDINTTGGIFADSNVGIGTATARYTLDINGDLNFSGDLYQGGSPFAGSPWDVSGSDISYTTGNVFIAGGLVTNTGGVTKKTYSYAGTFPAGTTDAQATLDIVFAAEVFSAKITAHLVEDDTEISVLSLDVGGGHKSGGTSPIIFKGPLTIFGGTNDNPWSSTVTTSTTTTDVTVSIKPTQAIQALITADYNIFVEYVSAASGGQLKQINDHQASPVTVTFGY